MARLLFWNAHKKATADVIAQIAASRRADVVALAEASHLTDETITERLRTRCQRKYYEAQGAFRIRVYSTLPMDYIRVLGDSMGMVFISVRQVFAPQLLVVFAHLPSKMGTGSASVAMLATRLRSEIEAVETRIGHSRTIVMGDLNMEPYDVGVVSSESLHATMCTKIAQRRTRQVNGRACSYFYNPMWNLLGDRTQGPPGTFYRSKSDPNTQFWHMLDQVLLRPDTIDLVDIESLAIVTRSEGVDLMTKQGYPDPRYSDHFPIFIATNDQMSVEEPI